MDSNINYCVYKHTTPNDKVYIGLTGQALDKRWRDGDGYRTQLFYRAIQKYGWDNIKHEVLEDNLSYEDACKKEIYYIQKYNSTNKNFGYNVAVGGGLVNVTPVCMYSYYGDLLKTYESSSIASKLTGIHDNAITNASNGYSKSAGGYVWRKLGDSFDKYPTPELDDYMLIKNGKTKIKQYDLYGNLLNTYNSLIDCKLEEHYVFYNIYKCCIGEVNTVYGYIWRFEDDTFDKYFQKYKIRNNTNNCNSIVVCDNKKFSNIHVFKYNFSGILTNVYKDVYEASEMRGYHINRILNCLHGTKESCGDYVYKFERDFNIEKNGYIRNVHSSPVKQYCLDGTFVKEYSSIVEAERETGATNISQCANGERHKSGGFVWRYKDDSFDKYPIEHKIPNIKRIYEGIKVYEFTLDGILNKIYSSLYELPTKQQGNIIKCIKGEIKSAYGYIYSFNTNVKPYEKTIPKLKTRKVAQYDLHTKQLIKIYNSIKEAKLETGADKISDCARHKLKTSGGYIWEYADVEEDIIE